MPGATGAGKTHTMMGSERSGDSSDQDVGHVSGIIPQSLVDIFDSVRARRQAAQAQQSREDWRVFASFLEVRRSGASCGHKQVSTSKVQTHSLTCGLLLVIFLPAGVQRADL